MDNTLILKEIHSEIHLGLFLENFGTLILNDEKKEFYEGYIKGIEEAMKIVNDEFAFAFTELKYDQDTIES